MKSIFTVIFLAVSFTVFGQLRTVSSKVKNLDTMFVSKYNYHFGNQYPDFVVQKNNEPVFSNKDMANKVVFINFWFTQCKVCIEEIGSLNSLYKSLKDQPNFLFVSFTFDSEETIENSIKKFNIQYRVFHLDQAEFRRLNFNHAMPTNVLLDKNGCIRYFMVGGFDKYIQEEFFPSILYQKIQNLL
jgi:cytochrome oxidase Cu insertion factor (SCO1/SenC/PrrC family)